MVESRPGIDQNHKLQGRVKGKITQEVVKLIMSWRHPGFNAHCGPRIQPGDDEAMENLARYVACLRRRA